MPLTVPGIPKYRRYERAIERTIYLLHSVSDDGTTTRMQKHTEDRKLEIAFLAACVQAFLFTFG